MERHKGFEPSTPAWKAGMLPLHQCRINMGDRGVEPLPPPRRARELISPAKWNRTTLTPVVITHSVCS